MKKTVAFVVAAVLLASAAAVAAEFWEKKKYQQWSAKECQKLLTDSPWTKDYTLSETYITPLQSPSVASPTTTDPAGISVPTGDIDTGVGDRAREDNPRLTYRVQFRSALPMRQAMVRAAQLNQNYDQMTPEQKQAFDQKAEQFLALEFPNTVVVYISFTSNVTLDERELQQHWQKQTTDTLKNFVFLVGSEGVKAPLQEYIVGKGAAQVFQFIFPREVEGRPLVGPTDKRLQLEFPHPKLRNQEAKRVLVEFKVNKMLVDGQLVY